MIYSRIRMLLGMILIDLVKVRVKNLDKKINVSISGMYLSSDLDKILERIDPRFLP